MNIYNVLALSQLKQVRSEADLWNLSENISVETVNKGNSVKTCLKNVLLWIS
jgi:hypothetical protein